MKTGIRMFIVVVALLGFTLLAYGCGGSEQPAAPTTPPTTTGTP